MQKVVGSSPIIRSRKAPLDGAFCRLSLQDGGTEPDVVGRILQIREAVFGSPLPRRHGTMCTTTTFVPCAADLVPPVMLRTARIGDQTDDEKGGRDDEHPVDARGIGSSFLARARTSQDRRDRENDDGKRAEQCEQRPDPAQIGPVGDAGDRETAHHDS